MTDCDQMVENGEITIEISCNVCGSDLDDDIMLLCDNCDNGFHTTCIGMNGIPNISQWFCKDCEWTLGDFQRKKQWIEMEKVGSKAEEEVKEHLEKPRKRLRKLNCAYIRRGK